MWTLFAGGTFGSSLDVQWSSGCMSQVENIGSEFIDSSLEKQFWLHLSFPLPAQSYLGHMEAPLAANNFSKLVFKSTGKLCPQAPSNPALIYYSSSGWRLALLDLGEQRVNQAKLLVRLASSAVCCESGILMADLITSSTYRVPAAHGAGTWHTLSLILRAFYVVGFIIPIIQVRKQRRSEVNLHIVLPDTKSCALFPLYNMS